MVKLFPDTRDIFGVTGKKALQLELPVFGGRSETLVEVIVRPGWFYHRIPLQDCYCVWGEEGRLKVHDLGGRFVAYLLMLYRLRS